MARAARWMLRVGAAVVAVLALLAATRLLAETPQAERWLARELARRASDALVGEVRVDAAELDGLLSVEARGVELLDLGATVARADVVRIEPSWPDVLRGGMVLDHVGILGLALELGPSQGGGGGFTTAIRPARAPGRGDEERARETSAGITVRELHVGFERVAVREAPGGEPRWVLADGQVRGRVVARPGGLVLDASAEARAVAPVQGRVGLDLAGRVEGGFVHLARLDATLPGGVRVAARSAEREPGSRPSTGAVLGELHVSASIPAEGALPYGGPALANPVEVSGAVRDVPEGIAFDATAALAGDGEIRVHGIVSGGSPPRFQAVIDARALDPARVVNGAVDGRLWFAIQASGAVSAQGPISGEVLIARSHLLGGKLGTGRASLAVRGGRAALQGLSLRLPGGRLAGSIALGGERPASVALDAVFQDIGPLASAARRADLDVPDVRGPLRVRVRVDGPRRAREVSVSLRSQGLLVAGKRVDRLALRGRLAGRDATFRVSGRTGRGRIALDARASRVSPAAFRLDSGSLAWAERSWRLVRTARLGWDERRVWIRGLAIRGGPDGDLELELDVPAPRAAVRSQPITGALRIDALPLAIVAALAPEISAAGELSATLALGGTVGRPRLGGHVSVSVDGGSEHGLDVTLELEATPERGEVVGEARMRSGPRAALSAVLRMPPGGRLWERGGLPRARIEGHLSARAIDLAQLARMGIVPAGVVRAGTVSADLSARGPLATVDLSGTVRVSGLVLGARGDPDLPAATADIRLDRHPRGLRARFEGEIAGAPPLHGEVVVPRRLVDLVRGARADVPFEATLRVGPGPVHLSRLAFSASSLSVAGSAGGTLGDPTARLSVRAKGVAHRGADVRALGLELRVSAALTEVHLRAEDEPGAFLGVRARLAAGEPWLVDVQARRAPLRLLALLPPFGPVDDAVADGSLRFRGGRSPTVEGELSVTAGSIEVTELATLRDLELRIRAQGRSVQVDQFAVGIGGGRAEGTASATWGEGAAHGTLDLSIERLPLPLGRRPLGEVTTDVSARVKLVGPELTGSVRVGPGEARLPDGLPGELHALSLPSDVVVHEPGAAAPRGASRVAVFLERLRARVEIDAPGDFWIRSEAADLELAADLIARWNGERLALTGDVVVPRGTVNVIRRRFEVERLQLTFRGDPDVDPALAGRIAFAQADLDVWIDLAGTLRSPELELRSDPPLDAAQLASRVAGAGGAGSADAAVTGAVLSGALNFFAGRLGEALAGTLPLDVLAIELGPRGEARRLEAGAYVAPRLFVSIVRNLLAEPDENTYEVRAEYEVLGRLTLSTRYGDGESGGVDLVYERRFRSASQRAQARERPDAPANARGEPSADAARATSAVPESGPR